MFNILVAGLRYFFQILVGSSLVKVITFAVLYAAVTGAAAYVFGVFCKLCFSTLATGLPGMPSFEFSFKGFALLIEWLLVSVTNNYYFNFFFYYFAVFKGFKIIICAYAIRFMIRRIPVVG